MRACVCVCVCAEPREHTGPKRERSRSRSRDRGKKKRDTLTDNERDDFGKFLVLVVPAKMCCCLQNYCFPVSTPVRVRMCNPVHIRAYMHYAHTVMYAHAHASVSQSAILHFSAPNRRSTSHSFVGEGVCGRCDGVLSEQSRVCQRIGRNDYGIIMHQRGVCLCERVCGFSVPMQCFDERAWLCE